MLERFSNIFFFSPLPSALYLCHSALYVLLLLVALQFQFFPKYLATLVLQRRNPIEADYFINNVKCCCKNISNMNAKNSSEASERGEGEWRGRRDSLHGKWKSATITISHPSKQATMTMTTIMASCDTEVMLLLLLMMMMTATTTTTTTAIPLMISLSFPSHS